MDATVNGLTTINATGQTIPSLHFRYRSCEIKGAAVGVFVSPGCRALLFGDKEPLRHGKVLAVDDNWASYQTIPSRQFRYRPNMVKRCEMMLGEIVECGQPIGGVTCDGIAVCLECGTFVEVHELAKVDWSAAHIMRAVRSPRAPSKNPN